MHRYVLTVQCPDRPGIVYAFAQALLDAEANILENAQFRDTITASFCLRTRFETPLGDIDEVRARLAPAVEQFGATLTLRDESVRKRVLIMVSKFDHCLGDLLYRWKNGELAIDLPLVVSNHFDCQELVACHGIPFVHLPVAPATRAAAEQRLVELVDEHRVDVVVLARYMQILSDRFATRLYGQIINIHHSFLPSFKGAKPYHQAHERGVKIIGATAHYVTPELDEGPIIEQETARVTHALSPDDLVAAGRDVESRVLARAVKLHLENRVMLNGKKTVVFG